MNILLADDHQLFLDGMGRIVRDHFSDAAVQLARTLDEVNAMLWQSFDLVLIDLHMPGVGSLEDIGWLIQRYPACPIVVLSALQDQATVDQCIAMGARGFLSKSMPSEQMLESIMRILQGDIIHPQLESTDHFFRGQAPKAHTGTLKVSERQLEILRALDTGQTNKQIAEALNISVNTVKNHISNLFIVMLVANRTECVSKARSLGFI